MVIRYTSFIKEVEKAEKVSSNALNLIYDAWKQGNPINLPIEKWRPFIIKHDKISDHLKIALTKLEQSKWFGIYAIIAPFGGGKSQFSLLLLHELEKKKISTNYVDLSSIPVYEVIDVIKKKIEVHIQHKRPIVVLIDNLDPYIFDRSYESVLSEIFLYVLSLIEKPLNYDNVVVPITIIFALNNASFYKLSSIYVKGMPVSTILNSLTEISWTPSEIEGFVEDFIKKLLVLLYLRTDNRDKIDKQFRIIVNFCTKIKEFLLQEREIRGIKTLVRNILTVTDIFVSNLALGVKKATINDILKASKNLLVHKIRHSLFNAIRRLPYKAEYVESMFIADVDESILNKIISLGKIQINLKDQPENISTILSLLTIDQYAEKNAEKITEFALKNPVVLFLLYLDKAWLHQIEKLYENIWQNAGKLLITIPLDAKIIQPLCYFRLDVIEKILEIVFTLSEMLTENLHIITSYVIADLILNRKTRDEIQIAYYLALNSWIRLLAREKRITITMAIKLLGIIITPILKKLGKKTDLESIKKVGEAIISRGERERIFSRSDNYLFVFSRMLEEEMIDTVMRSLLHELQFRVNMLL